VAVAVTVGVGGLKRNGTVERTNGRTNRGTDERTNANSEKERTNQRTTNNEQTTNKQRTNEPTNNEQRTTNKQRTNERTNERHHTSLSFFIRCFDGMNAAQCTVSQFPLSRIPSFLRWLWRFGILGFRLQPTTNNKQQTTATTQQTIAMQCNQSIQQLPAPSPQRNATHTLTHTLTHPLNCIYLGWLGWALAVTACLPDYLTD